MPGDKNGTEFEIPRIKEEIYRVPRIFKMLEENFQKYQINCIQGFLKIGKTYAVVDWIRSTSLLNDYAIFWMDCNVSTEQTFDRLVAMIRSGIGKVLIIVDHMEAISHDEWCGSFQKYLKSIPSHIKCIMITKGEIAQTFIELLAQNKMNLIPGLAIMLKEDEMEDYIHSFRNEFVCDHVSEYPLDLPKIPFIINLFIQYTRDNMKYDDRGVLAAAEKCYEYLNYEVIEQWNDELKETMAAMSFFDEISRSLIVAIYGDDRRYYLLEQLSKECCMVIRRGMDSFFIIPYIRTYIEREAHKYISEVTFKNIMRNAGYYYRTREFFDKALSCYERAKDYECLAEVLMSWLQSAPYKETISKTYEVIMRIPDHVVEENIKICGLRVLLALINMRLPEAVKWFSCMKLSVTKENSEERRRETERELVFLELLMPDTSVDVIQQRLRSGIEETELHETIERYFRIQGSELCYLFLLNHWQLSTEFVEMISSAKFESLYGLKISAIMRIYIGFYLVEQGNVTLGIRSISKGIAYSKQVGLDEVASYSVLYLKYVTLFHEGKEYQLTEFEREVGQYVGRTENVNELKNILMENYRLFNNSSCLNKEDNDVGLRCSQEPLQVFSFASIYTKCRFAIFYRDYTYAQMLLEAVREYCVQYRWSVKEVRVIVMLSILSYRRKDVKNAVQYLVHALELGKRLKMGNLISHEGAAILPILNEVRHACSDWAEDSYFKKVLEDAQGIARIFPKYLMEDEKWDVKLTPCELRVLKTLETPFTTAEIAKHLCISVNTVKHHIKNIYSKLNVNKRNMAVKVGRELGYL